MLARGILACAIAIWASSVFSCPVPNGYGPALDEVVSLTNTYRAKKRRKPLTPSIALNEAAQNHACFMASTGVLSHTGQGGSDLGNRVAATGFQYGIAAENIAEGQPFADSVVAAWAGSKGHRKNMLHKKITEIGVGVAVRNGRPFWVMVLAASR